MTCQDFHRQEFAHSPWEGPSGRSQDLGVESMTDLFYRSMIFDMNSRAKLPAPEYRRRQRRQYQRDSCGTRIYLYQAGKYLVFPTATREEARAIDCLDPQRLSSKPVIACSFQAVRSAQRAEDLKFRQPRQVHYLARS